MKNSRRNNKKNLDYIVIAVIVLLLLISLFVRFGISLENKKINSDDLNLNKYRSLSIPEECRLPEYETRVESWKEHLSHHQNTLYCLDYYS